MARQMILQYRDELLALQANELALQSSSSDYAGGRRMAEWTKALIPDDKDQIASDLLCILQKIPVSVIGQSLYIPPFAVCSADECSGQLYLYDGQDQIRSFWTA